MCVYFVAMTCAVKFGLGWAHDVFKFACHMFMHTYLHFFIFLYIDVFGAFLHVSLSPSLFLLVSCIMEPKWKSTPSQNPLCSRASSSSDHTPPHVQFCDDTGHPLSERTFWRTFVDKAFIQNAKSSYRNFLILTYPLSFTIGVGVTLWHPGHLFLYDHTWVLLQYSQNWHFCTSFLLSCLRYMHSSCACLRTIFKDELSSKHPLLGLCKRSKIPEHGDDIYSSSFVSL